MSKKHNQRTRAEILAKREQPLKRWAGWTRGAPAIITTQQPSSRSKYTPHIGAKEQARAKRCYMSAYLNEQVAQFHPRDGHLRVSPTLCQIGKATHAAYLEAREQEYESVF
jgi:hypothetical protein